MSDIKTRRQELVFETAKDFLEAVVSDSTVVSRYAELECCLQGFIQEPRDLSQSDLRPYYDAAIKAMVDRDGIATLNALPILGDVHPPYKVAAPKAALTKVLSLVEKLGFQNRIPDVLAHFDKYWSALDFFCLEHYRDVPDLNPMDVLKAYLFPYHDHMYFTQDLYDQGLLSRQFPECLLNLLLSCKDACDESIVKSIHEFPDLARNITVAIEARKNDFEEKELKLLKNQDSMVGKMLRFSGSESDCYQDTKLWDHVQRLLERPLMASFWVEESQRKVRMQGGQVFACPDNDAYDVPLQFP